MKKYYIDNLNCFHIKHLRITEDKNNSYYHRIEFQIKSILKSDSAFNWEKGDWHSICCPKSFQYIYEFEKNADALLFFEVNQNE